MALPGTHEMTLTGKTVTGARQNRNTGHIDSALRACADCGAFVRASAPPLGFDARCIRCGFALRRSRRIPADTPLALALSGVALSSAAIFMPFMSVNIAGQQVTATLLTGPGKLYDQGLWALALLVILTTLLAPAVKLGANVYLLARLRRTTAPTHLRTIHRWILRITPWAMIEVYLLGVFVAYTKLTDMGQIHVGTSLFTFVGVMLAMVASDAAWDAEGIWMTLDDRAPPPRHAAERLAAPRPGAIGCHCCGVVALPSRGRNRCPRCGDRLHRRKADSIARTWALLIAAAILYLPANLYPVMTVISLGQGTPDTIVSGVKELYLGGMWPLALLVFFASIVVPVLKLLGLALILVTTQRRSRWRLRDRATLYRVVEFVGRWSMIDIFMLSILVGLVQLGSIATIAPGIGALSFSGVVILTMLAAESFDPRLMWDVSVVLPPKDECSTP